MIGPTQQKHFNTPGFEGNPALADVEKEMVEDMQLEINALSLPARVIGMGVENLCKSHPIAESFCKTVGEYVISPAHYLHYILENRLPTPLNKVAKQTFEKFEKTPDLWEEKYGIPKEHSKHSLESLNIVVESAIGGGTGAVIARVPNALRKLRTIKPRLNYFSDYSASTKEFSRVKEFKGVLKKDLILVRYHDEGAIIKKSWKWWTSTKVANQTDTLTKVKDRLALLDSFGAKTHVTVARIPKGTSIQLLQGRAKSQFFNGATPEFRAGGGYQIRLKEFDERWIKRTCSLDSPNVCIVPSPQKAVSHTPAKAGIIALLVLHPLNKDFINPESLADAIMSVALESVPFSETINNKLDAMILKSNILFLKRGQFQKGSTMESEINVLTDANISSSDLLETIQSEKDEVSSTQEPSSLDLSLLEINGFVSLDQPKKINMSLSMPVGEGDQIGTLVHPNNMKASSVSFISNLEGVNLGGRINLLNPKNLPLEMGSRVGQCSNVGIIIDPFKMEKTTVTGSYSANGMTYGGNLNIKHPEDSTISVSTLTPIPITIEAPIKHLENAVLTIGVPIPDQVNKVFKNAVGFNLPKMHVSIPIKKIFRWGKKKRKKRSASSSNIVFTPTLFQQTQKNLKDLEIAVHQLQRSNENREVSQNAFLSIEPQKLDQIALKKEITVNSLKEIHQQIQEKVELLHVQDEASIQEFKNITNQLITTLSNEDLIQKVKSKISPQKKAELRKLRFFE